MPFFRRDEDPGPDPKPERFQELMVDGQPDFEDLLGCVFGISEPVAEVYRFLLDNPESTVIITYRYDSIRVSVPVG